MLTLELSGPELPLCYAVGRRNSTQCEIIGGLGETPTESEPSFFEKHKTLIYVGGGVLLAGGLGVVLYKTCK